MNSHTEEPVAVCENLSDFARVMKSATSPAAHSVSSRAPGRINLDTEEVKNGLGRLVLTLVRLLHEILERQAIHRMEAGSLDDDEIERLGLTLMKQAEEIEGLRKLFGLKKEDLTLDLGPLGRLV